MKCKTIRISTQALPRIHARNVEAGHPSRFFHDLDNLAKQEGFIAGIGPALMSEKDDPAQAAGPGGNSRPHKQSARQRRCGGRRWRPLEGRFAAAADAMKYSRRTTTDHSLGNFRFAAIANVPAYTPFYYPAFVSPGTGAPVCDLPSNPPMSSRPPLAVQRDPEGHAAGSGR